MRVLVACEYSGVVRDAFRNKGHEAYSCDILAGEGDTTYHIQDDVMKVIEYTKLANIKWDLIIAHPPCTYLAVSGNRWYSHRPDLFIPAADFARTFFDFAPMVAVENPVGRLSKLWRKPDQYIQPWEYGHDASKKTGLWLKNLPLLTPTNIIKKDRYANQTPSGQNKLGPSPERAKERSRTYEGIAHAMAEQWG